MYAIVVKNIYIHSTYCTEVYKLECFISHDLEF